ASRRGGFWLANYAGAPERLAPDGGVERLPAAVAEAIGGAKTTAIAEAVDGTLWLGARDQLIRVAGGGVRIWRAGDGADALLPGLDLLRIAPDGSLWLSCNGTCVQQRDPRGGRVLRSWLAHAAGVGAADFEATVFGDDGTLWLAGDEGVRVLAPGARDSDPAPAMGADGGYARAREGGPGGPPRRTGRRHTQRGGDGWRRAAAVGQHQGLAALEAAGMAVEAMHRLWLTTARGLFRWDPASARLRRLGM